MMQPRQSIRPALILLSSLFAAAQSFAVTLILNTKTAGDGAETINVTGEYHEEVSLPIYESFIKGTEQGYAWGGFKIGDKNVIVTNTRIYDFEGNDTVRAAQIIGDENGMGIDSKGRYEGERPWMIDGKEGTVWTANQDIQFTGLRFRAGWDGGTSLGKKELSISSPAWVNLKGVQPHYGIQYIPESGTFVVSNRSGSVSLDHKVTVDELVGLNGPRLDVPVGVVIAFVHTGEVSELGGFALKSLSFDPASGGSYQPIPEPQAYAIILSLFAVCFATMTRRIR